MLSWKWCLVTVFIGVYSQSAEAGDRYGRWSSRYVQQGGNTQYYRPTNTTSVQSYGNQAQSGCVHGPNGSTCNHNYNVNRQYSVDQGNNQISAGAIRYSGGRGNNYYHSGSAYEISNIDSREQQNAGANKKRMEVLNEIAGLKASLEQRRAQLVAAGGSYQQRSELDVIIDAYQTVADQLAAATQARNDVQATPHLRSGIDWAVYALKHEVTYLDRWESTSWNYQNRRAELNKTLLTFALVQALLK